ncbi:MAG: hypothetical protein KUG82_09835 [Pseudomonadales bacterium]|nr:hypothetical protein [Pseudomonadales bacterium]
MIGFFYPLSVGHSLVVYSVAYSIITDLLFDLLSPCAYGGNGQAVECSVVVAFAAAMSVRR